MTIVGVMPAAGYALRLQPLERSKEMLEVGGRPVMDYVAERMRAGGAEVLRVVTRPEKEDVAANAERLGATVVLARPANINLSFAAGLSGLKPDDVALLGFPDSVWEPEDGYRKLVDAVKAGSEVALGLFEAPGLQSDYIRLDGEGGIEEIEIKPARPPSDWIWGAAAARVRALEGLERREWPSQHMNALLREGRPVAAVRLSNAYLDIGTRASLALADAWNR